MIEYNDSKWRQERAENVKIGDLIKLENGGEFFVVRAQKGFDGYFHIFGYKGDVPLKLNPVSSTFVCYIRREDHFESGIVDLTTEIDNCFAHCEKHYLLQCKEDVNGFTKGRTYLVEEEGKIDKFVVDDNGRERTLALLRLDCFKILD